ncbi:MAG TPA: hypothetical protein VML55_01070 [Planctomycetaceae bacterium]|nr:hypothetical protein [Planctomycetaceae bacterium]
MLAYAELARVSIDKRQRAGSDRLLVLTAAAACRAGWPRVAECCRRLVLEHNPRHLIGRQPSVADCLRDAAFQALLKQLERLCPYERAEHLLTAAGTGHPTAATGPQAAGTGRPAAGDAGRQALAILGCGEPLE